MDHTDMSLKDLIAEAIAFADHEIIPRLGYTDVSFNQVYAYNDATVQAVFNVTDDFQEKVGYYERVQHGSLILEFPLSLNGLFNREQREHSVMLKQQGNSTALYHLMVSAAGRKFVGDLSETRSKYAPLVDMRHAGAPDPPRVRVRLR